MKTFLIALTLAFSSPTHAQAPALPTAPALRPDSKPAHPPGLTRPPAPLVVPAPAQARPCSYPGPTCVLAFRFSTPIAEDSVKLFQKFLEVAQRTGVDEVLVEMATPGGEYAAGHDLARSIEMSPVRVTCIADGIVASMGFYVFESCDRRVTTKRAMLMAHGSGVVVPGSKLTEPELLMLAARVRGLNHAYGEQIVAKTNLTMKQYLAKVANGREWWLGWEEAQRVGAVDAVWPGHPNEFLAAMAAGLI